MNKSVERVLMNMIAGISVMVAILLVMLVMLYIKQNII